MTPERRAEIEAMGRSYRNCNQSGWKVDDTIRELLAEIDRLSGVVLDAIEHDAIGYDQRNPHLMALYDAILPHYNRRHPESLEELERLFSLQRSQHDPAQPLDDEVPQKHTHDDHHESGQNDPANRKDHRHQTGDGLNHTGQNR